MDAKREQHVHPAFQFDAISLRPVIGRKILGPERPVVLLIAEIANPLDLLGRQLELRGAQVVAQTLLLGRGRDGNDVLVDAPA